MGIRKNLILGVKGQMKIQQMTFMILAVFLFFILVGIFMLNFQLKDIRKDVLDLNKEKAISSLEVISNMPEINCGSGRTLCLDEDKLKIMSGNFGQTYSSFWPVASIKVYKVYPEINSEIRCPAINCNYYLLYQNNQNNSLEYSTYVNVCKKVRLNGYVEEICDISKLVVGMRISDD